MHWWFSWRMLACHVGGPASNLGRCIFIVCFNWSHTEFIQNISVFVRRWFNGRILAFVDGGLCSIPGRCIIIVCCPRIQVELCKKCRNLCIVGSVEECSLAQLLARFDCLAYPFLLFVGPEFKLYEVKKPWNCASVVQWMNALLLRGRPGFDSRLMQIYCFFQRNSNWIKLKILEIAHLCFSGGMLACHTEARFRFLTNSIFFPPKFKLK